MRAFTPSSCTCRLGLYQLSLLSADHVLVSVFSVLTASESTTSKKKQVAASLAEPCTSSSLVSSASPLSTHARPSTSYFLGAELLPSKSIPPSASDPAPTAASTGAPSSSSRKKTTGNTTLGVPRDTPQSSTAEMGTSMDGVAELGKEPEFVSSAKESEHCRLFPMTPSSRSERSVADDSFHSIDSKALPVVIGHLLFAPIPLTNSNLPNSHQYVEFDSRQR